MLGCLDECDGQLSCRCQSACGPCGSGPTEIAGTARCVGAPVGMLHSSSLKAGSWIFGQSSPAEIVREKEVCHLQNLRKKVPQSVPQSVPQKPPQTLHQKALFAPPPAFSMLLQFCVRTSEKNYAALFLQPFLRHSLRQAFLPPLCWVSIGAHLNAWARFMISDWDLGDRHEAVAIGSSNRQ